MTVKLSQQKISRLLKYYFAGMTQPAIAQKLGIDQSSVSLYAKRFSERAAMIGLLEAAKEYNVCNEIGELRNLSVEMQKYNLTTEDAREGVGIIKAFSKLDVPTDQHTKLIQVAKKIDNPGFINASLELVRIEEKEKISYEEAITKYQAILSQLPLKQNELTRTQTQLNSLHRSTTEKERELNNVNTQLKQVQENTRVKRESLELDYEAKRQQLQVIQEEVEAVAQVKTELKKDDLDIETFAIIVKEYRSGTGQIQGMLIRRDMEKHHSLKKSNEALTNEVAIQNQEYARLKSKNSELNQNNDRIIAGTEENEKRFQDGSFKLDQLLMKINRYSRQYALFQGFLAMIGNSPSASRPIESLINSLQMIMRSGWYTSRTEKEWMGLFVQRVFGDYLQSFRCDHCGGSRFMISRGTNMAYKYYQPHCPVCHYSSWVKSDDSFLRAMVSEEQRENVYKAELLMKDNAILKPFKVLVDIPCEVCHQQVKDWTEDKVIKFATGLGWAHEECRKTFTGVMAQLGLVSKYIPKIEEKPSLPKVEEARKEIGK